MRPEHRSPQRPEIEADAVEIRPDLEDVRLRGLGYAVCGGEAVDLVSPAEARRLLQKVAPVHLLAGLLLGRKSVAAEILERHGVTIARVRAATEQAS